MKPASRLDLARIAPAAQKAIGYRGRFLAEVIGAGGLLALVTLAFFWRILLTPHTWMPAGGGDLAPFLYPNYHFAAEHLGQGIVPLWNPHLYSGAPFAADIQSGLFYPVNVLIFMLVPNLTYQWLEYLAVFHFWLAGMTMYLCLRLLIPSRNGLPALRQGMMAPIGPLAAFAGALAFEFSDLFIVHFGNLNMIAVAAWLPLVFLLFHHSLLKSSLALAAASGVVLAVATLAGHIQITLFILLSLGLYTLWHTAVTWKQKIGDETPIKTGTRPEINSSTFNLLTLRISRLRPFLNLLISLLVMLGLSALLLFPAYEMSQYTPRAELPYDEAVQYSLHPVQMIGLFVPGYFGRDPALHWGPWDRVETGYIGVITLMLALTGAIIYPGRIRKYFTGLAILSLLLAMGGYLPVHGWLYNLAPGFDQLRAPARFILLLDFSLAALAAFGFNQLLQSSGEKVREVLPKLLKITTWSLGAIIAVAVPLSYYAMLVTQDQNPVIFNRAVGAASGVAIFTFFAGGSLIVLHLIAKERLQSWRAGLAVIALLGLDLFTLGQNVDMGHTNPVEGFDHPAALAFLKTDPNLYRIEVSTDVWHLWQPNTALLHRLYDAWGLYNPLTLADTTLYWSGVAPRSSGRYNFLGIKYIVASKDGAPADGRIVPVFNKDPDINIYLNEDALARAVFVGETTVVSRHDAAWEAVRAEGFDPASQVVLEGGQPLDTQPVSSLAFQQYDLHTVVLSVETDQSGYLVLSDAYYPGWLATVDGQPVPIRRANYAFRAVYVPAGRHTVKFTFEPIIWKVGLGVSGLTLVILLAWVSWRQWSPKRG